MNRTLITLAVASILLTGCARAAQAPRRPSGHVPSEILPGALPDERGAAKEARKADVVTRTEDKSLTKVAEGARKPGDYIVYRFSGSYRKSPLTLTERVIGREGELLIVDLALQSNGATRELRIKINEGSSAKNEIASVMHLEGGMEKPAGQGAYEALMAETTLAADQNEALLGSEEVTIDIGGSVIPARKTSYRVRIGKHRATLRTLESDGFAWGDLGGEITTESGKTLYRAEIVEAGHAAPGASVARAGH